MKTVIADSLPQSWYFLPDSALVNSGKPFFIPDFADSFEAWLAPVVKLDRMGKSIGARFAGRYWNEIAPAVHFRAPELRKSLLEASLPPDRAQGFDRSMTVGDTISIDTLTPTTTLHILKNGTRAASVNIHQLLHTASEMLEQISVCNTVKTGDYLVPVLAGPLPISIGDRLSVCADDKVLLFIDIK